MNPPGKSAVQTMTPASEVSGNRLLGLPEESPPGNAKLNDQPTCKWAGRFMFVSKIGSPLVSGRHSNVKG